MLGILSSNLYQFVRNNPLIYVDPAGLNAMGIPIEWTLQAGLTSAQILLLAQALLAALIAVVGVAFICSFPVKIYCLKDAQNCIAAANSFALKCAYLACIWPKHFKNRRGGVDCFWRHVRDNLQTCEAEVTKCILRCGFYRADPDFDCTTRRVKKCENLCSSSEDCECFCQVPGDPDRWQKWGQVSIKECHALQCLCTFEMNGQKKLLKPKWPKKIEH
jgi:hypothetical protein